MLLRGATFWWSRGRRRCGEVNDQTTEVLMTRLHLIRHGRPVVDATIAASGWALSTDDEPFAALTAAPGFPRHGRWVSSSEPKAIDTARRLREMLGQQPGDVHPSAALGEMHRPAVWADAATFGRDVERSFQNPAEPAALGWESAVSVLDRVREEVVGRCDQAMSEGSASIVLVGHGAAWSLLVATILDRPVDVAAWRRMRTPDWCVLDVAVTAGVLTGSLIADWGAWATG